MVQICLCIVLSERRRVTIIFVITEVKTGLFPDLMGDDRFTLTKCIETYQASHIIFLAIALGYQTAWRKQRQIQCSLYLFIGLWCLTVSDDPVGQGDVYCIYNCTINYYTLYTKFPVKFFLCCKQLVEWLYPNQARCPPW